MVDALIRHPEGFAPGYTPIVRRGEPADTGMDFGVHQLRRGQTLTDESPLERAYLLLSGDVTIVYPGGNRSCRRGSCFDDEPFALHVPAGARVQIDAHCDSELVVVAAENPDAFEPRLFDPETMLESEHRGRGQLGDTAYRIVRTIFDGRNRPEGVLVLGEVVNFPGRWSSYPPHHHAQPEIYHYRFTKPQGYGHAELGEQVLKVRHGDTIKILDGHDHSQVAAPGYGMFYVWAIRHLPGRPYTVPEFTQEHRWLLDKNADVWSPRKAGR